jgi:uncharacterized coiled-coil protein SlyX
VSVSPRTRSAYLTEGRVAELEAYIAVVEARLIERLEQQSRELEELRQRQGEQLRAQVRALLDVLQNSPATKGTGT